MKLRLLVSVTLAFWSSMAAAHAQTTWHVDVDAIAPGSGTLASPYTSIQYALSRPSTVSGDVILVHPGAYIETIDFLGKGVSLRSTAGAGATAIDGQQIGTVVTIRGPVFPPAELEGFTIRSGVGTPWEGKLAGGGILCEDTHAYVRACIIERNSAVLGGGVFSARSDLTLASCVIRGNTAETAPGFRDGYGGGFYTNASTDRVQGCQIDRNVAERGGGIFATGSTLTVSVGKIRENETGQGLSDYAYGGGLYADGGGILFVRQVEISANIAWGEWYGSGGAGLYLSGLNQALVQECTIRDNSAGEFFTGFGNGGGIHATGFQVRVEDTLIEGNVALFEGGGVYGDGEYVRCTIKNSMAQFGGGAYGNMLLRRCKITDNFAGNWEGSDEGQGGGVYGGWLEECELIGNEATDGGGAIYATLVDCVVADNWVAPFYVEQVFGGGVYECTLVRCRLSGNTAFGYPWASGGGAADSALTDCEVFDNKVVGGGAGGGVYSSTLVGCRLYGNSALGSGAEALQGGGADSSSLSFCAVFDNVADEGGGASNSQLDRSTVWGNQAAVRGDGLFYESALTLSNSIVWNNGAEEILDLSGGLIVDYCDVKGGWTEANIALDPALWDPDQGDFHLLPGSPCIDAGNPFATPDPDGSRADIGAHSYDPTYCGKPSTYCTAKLNSLGCAPRIDFTGTPSLTGADDFFVVASEVLANKPAFLLWSLDGTPLNSPHLGGWICTGVPLQRTGGQVSTAAIGACQGTLSFHFSQPFMDGARLGFGTTVYAQYVSRDSGVPGGFSLTNGLRFVLCP